MDEELVAQPKVVVPPVETPPVDGKPVEVPPDNKKTEESVPYNRFKEVNARMQQTQAEMAKMAQELAEMRKERDESRSGEFEQAIQYYAQEIAKAEQEGNDKLATELKVKQAKAITIKATEEAEKKLKSKFEKDNSERSLKEVIDSVNDKYPQLDPNKDEFNQEMLDLAIVKRDRKIHNGMPLAQAIKEAAMEVCAKKEDPRNAKALSRGIDTENKQAPDIGSSLASSDKKGGILTYEQYAKLPQAERDKLLGKV